MKKDNRVLVPVEGSHILVFWCGGCGYMHHVDPLRWEFNGDMVRPTVNPSLLLHPGKEHPRCHLFIRDGHLQYLNDCGHELAGKTVKMTPPWSMQPGEPGEDS